MELTTNDIDQLTAYHRGQLAPEIVQELQRRIAADPVFRTAVAEWETLWIVSFQPTAEEEALRERFRTLLSEHRERIGPYRPANGRRWWLWGLVLLVVALLSWGLYRYLQPETDPAATPVLAEIGAAATQAPDILGTLGEPPADVQTKIKTGMEAYEAKDYRTAWRLLSAPEVLETEPLYGLYAGIAARFDGRPRKAVELLEPLRDQEAYAFYAADINWQLALAYYSAGRGEAARPLLELLAAAEQGKYRQEAAALLRKIVTQ